MRVDYLGIQIAQLNSPDPPPRRGVTRGRRRASDKFVDVAGKDRGGGARVGTGRFCRLGLRGISAEMGGIGDVDRWNLCATPSWARNL